MLPLEQCFIAPEEQRPLRPPKKKRAMSLGTMALGGPVQAAGTRVAWARRRHNNAGSSRGPHLDQGRQALAIRGSVATPGEIQVLPRWGSRGYRWTRPEQLTPAIHRRGPIPLFMGLRLSLPGG